MSKSSTTQVRPRLTICTALDPVVPPRAVGLARPLRACRTLASLGTSTSRVLSESAKTTACVAAKLRRPTPTVDWAVEVPRAEVVQPHVPHLRLELPVLVDVTLKARHDRVSRPSGDCCVVDCERQVWRRRLRDPERDADELVEEQGPAEELPDEVAGVKRGENDQPLQPLRRVASGQAVVDLCTARSSSKARA